MEQSAEHWEGIYQRSPLIQLSWYERDPATSRRLIEMVASGPDTSVIDIGSGASSLVDQLLERGFTDLTVFDIARTALDQVRDRLGEAGQRVSFVEHDVLTWEPDREHGVWDDRAVFHFLTDQNERNRYSEIAANAIRPGGSLVLATFAEDGPTQCSGLLVARYSADDLRDVFMLSFSLVREEREVHLTPGGVVQPFTWVVLRRC